MSHEIKIISKQSHQTISTVNFGGCCAVRANLIYQALDAADFNNGMSGSGDTKEYTKAELELALRKLTYLSGEPVEDLPSDVKNDRRNEFLGLFGQTASNVLLHPEELEADFEQFFNFLKKAIASEEENFIIDFG